MRKRFAQPNFAHQSRKSLEFETVRDFFSQKARTQRGRQSLRTLSLKDRADQKRHYEEMVQWPDYLDQYGPLWIPEIPEQQCFHRNPNQEPFTAQALRELRDILAFWVRVADDKHLAFARHGLELDQEAPPLLRRLSNLFEADGSWREDVTPKYAGLCRQYRQIEAQIEQSFQRCIKKYSAYLNESIVFERNQRKVLAVKQNFKGKVPGILQDSSASGSSAYLEPQETVSSQNRLREFLIEMEEELWTLRCELTVEILGYAALAKDICPLLAHMDKMQALALVAKETQSRFIQPNHEQQLHLLEARHPLLDQAFASFRQRAFNYEEPDKNHMVAFCLGLDQDQRGLIISGANTGGKTVTLKTTGLLAWMANSGMPVPVDEGSTIPFYTSILADIGDHQSLNHNLSTFASYLANIRQVFEAEAAHSLVLLDEMGSGTDPQEGNALSQAIIESLIQKGYHLVITTHQQILCTLALNHPHLENGSMIFDSRRLKPTYRFQQGVPGRSHALEIAKASGLPESVLDKAHDLIDHQQVDIQAAIRRLQAQHKELQKQKQKVRKDELRLHRRIRESREEAEKLRAQEAAFREKAKVKLKKTVERADRELRKTLADIESQKRRRSSLSQFAKTTKNILEPYETPEKLENPEVVSSGLPMDQWRTGDRVFLKTWAMEGILTEISPKRAKIDCQGKLLNTDPYALIHLGSPSTEKTDLKAFDIQAEDHHLSVELQLLGYRVEEALSALDKALDNAFRQDIPFLKIIHGHGTGALKSAVRNFLKNHQAKHHFQVSVDPENDGITELNFQDLQTTEQSTQS